MLEVENGLIEEIAETPNPKYNVETVSQNGDVKAFRLTDKTTGKQMAVDLLILAEKNVRLSQLLQTAAEKVYEGVVIRDAIILDEAVYFVIEVHDRIGEAYEVVFEYNAETDAVYFVLWSYLSDRVKDYYIVRK